MAAWLSRWWLSLASPSVGCATGLVATPLVAPDADFSRTVATFGLFGGMGLIFWLWRKAGELVVLIASPTKLLKAWEPADYDRARRWGARAALVLPPMLFGVVGAMVGLLSEQSTMLRAGGIFACLGVIFGLAMWRLALASHLATIE